MAANDDDLCCRMYEKAKKFGPPDMEKSSLEAIIRKTPLILTAKSFINLSNEAVCGVLEDVGLRARNELDIFNAVLRMGCHKCTSNELEASPQNLRLILIDVIPLIRFPLMDEQSYLDFVVPSGLLDEDELDAMTQWWRFKKGQGPEPSDMPFETLPRKFLKSDSSNFCESSTTFAAALKYLEDFSAAALYTGNVNVVALSGILCEMQKMMQSMAADLKFTQQDLLQKTSYLEFLISRAKDEFSTAHKEAAANVDSINTDLQGTKAQLTGTQTDLFETKAQLAETRSDFNKQLESTTANFQHSIKLLDKKARKNLEQTANDLETEIKMEAGKTAENFEALKKDLRDTETGLRESTENLETKLEETKSSLKDTQCDLRVTKMALQSTQMDLKKTNENLDQVNGDLQAMIHTVEAEQKEDLSRTNDKLEETQRDLEKTQKDLRDTTKSLAKTTQDLLRTKSKLEDTLNELNNTKSNLDTTKCELDKTRKLLSKAKQELEASVQKTAGFLDETKLKFDVKIEELYSKAGDSREKLGRMKLKLKEAKEEIGEIKSERPVPLGFIYIQFSKQPEPSELWPQLQWMEVTEEYAGHFYRALGGNPVNLEGAQTGQDGSRIPTVTTRIWKRILAN